MSTKDTVQKFARNVWLAGLGAYGKGAQSITESIDKAYVESNQLFNDLVVKGSEIQLRLESKLKEQTAFELKVDQVRQKLGLNQDISEEQIEALSAKVESLTEIVATFAEQKLVEATQTELEKSSKNSAKSAAIEDSNITQQDKPASRGRKPKAATKPSV